MGGANSTKRKGNNQLGETAAIKRSKQGKVIDDEGARQFLLDLGCDEKFLRSGKVLARTLEPDDPTFSLIRAYVARGQDGNLGVKIQTILRILPRANHLESDDTPSFNHDLKTQGPLRKMLWHGTPKKAVSSILKNGLRCPVKNKLINKCFMRHLKLGTGIYFADRISLSTRYCDWRSLDSLVDTSEDIFIFLCNVHLGEMFETEVTLPTTTWSPPSKIFQDGRANVECQSVKLCGQYAPDEMCDRKIDGCIWPLGWPVKDRSLEHFFNEYVIYRSEQVQPKYLLKVQLTAEPYFGL